MCYMVVAKPEKKSAVEIIQSISVASEYADVFLDDMPGLPPSRDIDFTIDLIPGTSLVSMALYRMAPQSSQNSRSKLRSKWRSSSSDRACHRGEL